MNQLEPSSYVKTTVQAVRGGKGPTATSYTSRGLGGDGYDVILVIGQSNAEGYGNPLDLSIDPPDPLVYQFPQSASNSYYRTIIPAVDPLFILAGGTPGPPGIAPPRIGFATTFARAYAAGSLAAGRRVLISQCAWSGTGFAAGPSWAVGGARYLSAVAGANAAIASHPNNNLVAMLWLQGEWDVLFSMSQASYQTLFWAMIAGMRAEISGAANCKFILAGMVPEYITDHGADGAAIDAAHRNTPANVARCAFVPGPSGANNGDNTHYNAAGQRIIGADMYAAWLSL